MSEEITTEVIARAIDKTRDIARSGAEEVWLDIGDKEVKFVVLDSVGSDDSNAMNAMAFAPIKGDGTPDYSNVAVVFAGTNNVNLMGDTGKTGTGGAIRSMGGYLSPEYKPASAFLEKTLMSVESKPGGRVTDVGGFSQSGAYLMKMTAVYAPVHGFQSVSFDDFGGMQQRTLTADELAWLKENPQAFLRYRNARSFAAYSLRDHIYGTIVSVSLKEHDTLARYFDGDALNLDRLAKDGHFVSGMSAEQVALAARTFLKDNPSWMSGLSEKERIAARIKDYLRIYGPYGTGAPTSGTASGVGTVGLVSGFAASGAKLIDDAIDHLQAARQTNDDIPGKLQESYQRVLQETSAMWFWVIDSYDVEEEAHRRGLQPERHMNLDAISQASTKIGKEIEELAELKATLVNVSSRRERQDVQQAAGFRF